MMGIQCSKISNNELSYIEGYSWEKDIKTKNEFDKLKSFDTGYKEGNICLDLLNNNFDIIDTITITTRRFNRLTSRAC
jgi:hypothetical protein